MEDDETTAAKTTLLVNTSRFKVEHLDTNNFFVVEEARACTKRKGTMEIGFWRWKTIRNWRWKIQGFIRKKKRCCVDNNSPLNRRLMHCPRNWWNEPYRSLANTQENAPGSIRSIYWFIFDNVSANQNERKWKYSKIRKPAHPVGKQAHRRWEALRWKGKAARVTEGPTNRIRSSLPGHSGARKMESRSRWHLSDTRDEHGKWKRNQKR